MLKIAPLALQHLRKQIGDQKVKGIVKLSINQYGKDAGIEHLKLGHRLTRNYLSGKIGDNTNVMLAAAGHNVLQFLVKLRHFCHISSTVYQVGDSGYRLR